MTNEEFQTAPVKSPITIADLDKIDIRVGTILSVEDVIGSDKLVKLVVDFGDRRRNILAGMQQERPHPRAIEGETSAIRSQSGTKEDGGRAFGRNAVRYWVR